MGRIPNGASKKRRLLRQRAECAYCAEDLTEETATLDHMKARAAGGTNAIENLILACRLCNECKGCCPYQKFLALISQTEPIDVTAIMSAKRYKNEKRAQMAKHFYLKAAVAQQKRKAITARRKSGFFFLATSRQKSDANPNFAVPSP